MRKILSTLAASGLLVTAAAIAAPAANAAPITCPPGQTVQKVNGDWVCVNGGGNNSGAENPKNPNAPKSKF